LPYAEAQARRYWFCHDQRRRTFLGTGAGLLESVSREPSLGLNLRGGASISSPRSLVQARHPRPAEILTRRPIRGLACRAVGRFARNEPCPCGSGVKFKRCCIGREDEVERRADALEVLAGLGSFFPLTRPCGGQFEAWLATHASSEPDQETIHEGLARLTEADRRAIIDAYASRYPDVWRGVVADVGGDEIAEGVVIAGAMTAALSESREPIATSLIWVAEENDPAEALAFALDATNLWSVLEATLLDEALGGIPDGLTDGVYETVWDATIDEATRLFWSEAHARRLDVLVQRLRVSLPSVKPEAAARVLAEACDAFAADEDVRHELAVNLLSDALGALPRMSTAAAA
jgi:SEC-C motif-containing protein